MTQSRMASSSSGLVQMRLHMNFPQFKCSNVCSSHVEPNETNESGIVAPYTQNSIVVTLKRTSLNKLCEQKPLPRAISALTWPAETREREKITYELSIHFQFWRFDNFSFSFLKFFGILLFLFIVIHDSYWVVMQALASFYLRVEIGAKVNYRMSFSIHFFCFFSISYFEMGFFSVSYVKEQCT